MYWNVFSPALPQRRALTLRTSRITDSPRVSTLNRIAELFGSERCPRHR
jgi:hypothetical protein